MAWQAALPLVGAGGEPVDLRRTFRSHGVASLPPMRVCNDGERFEVTLASGRGRPRTLRISASGEVRAAGRAPTPSHGRRLLDSLRHVLRLDEDLSAFYALAAGDPKLSWATSGAGRMVRSPTVFEEVVKTICTTNVAWSATERMVGSLVSTLGQAAPDGRHAFPTPAAMASRDEAFYRDVVRAGYRSRYLVALARAVSEGRIDIEALGTDPSLDDDALAAALLTIPGIGPYAAAHVMMMLGRYSRLILDSWTRPTYARLVGRDAVGDAEIIEHFAPYGRWAGLAFWLVLTRGWVDDLATPGA